MKLCDELEKLLNPRQANANSKSLKKECPMCGVKVPISKGRYPNNCPGCGKEFENDSDMEEDLERIIDGFIFHFKKYSKTQLAIDPLIELIEKKFKEKGIITIR